MDISIILCTWNNSKRLSITLDAFLKIESPSSVSWELVIVDNNSKDATRDIVVKYTGCLPIKYVIEATQGVSFARNAGLRNATGDLVIFTDDDITPCTNWLQIYWIEYKLNPSGFFWGGPIESDFESEPIDLDLISHAPSSVKGLSFGCEQRELLPSEFFIGANWAIPSDVLSRVGCFNVSLGLNPSSGKVLVGEETDLMMRLIKSGLKPLYLPKATIKHFVPQEKMSIDHIASRSIATGRHLAADLLCNQMPSFLGVPRWIYRKIITSWIKTKLKKTLRMKWYNDYFTYCRFLGCIKQIMGK